jgi:hypothetical protein
MMLDFYNLEKLYEFQQKETELRAREYWKWTKLLKRESRLKLKEVNDN